MASSTSINQAIMRAKKSLPRLWDRALYAIQRRPVRVLEAIVVLAAAVGVTVDPSLLDRAGDIITAGIVLGVFGGEVAQRYTTSWLHPALEEGEPIDAETVLDQARADG
jgi:hypothetical protein